MKKKYMLIILASTVLGILIGSIIKDFQSKKELYISKDDIVKKEIKVAKKSIKNLKKEKIDLDEELDTLKEKYIEESDINQIEELKEILSYTDVQGDGITIKIDSLNEDVGNIANSVDYNKILINLVNNLKVNGGKYISINGQRLNQYSEIILAGSHININSVPIAQPYEVKVIGDLEKLSSYINENNNYIENIAENYPMKVEYKIEKNISLPKIEVPNKLKYIKEG
ncbi:DUF881 domain-containing protein [Romboutsia sp. CE17]|uniref:DUF881 domain-containing protein n=1 Tax=Romboutsia sp. CE17 TaxID=2724150 RepID=UPI001442D8E0|nr:DUF881 domain-containing protein [Romboutsia sp. CE17]QJA10034.1 DUF881 domain-containing protein [Romboutsia sp. CE17]